MLGIGNDYTIGATFRRMRTNRRIRRNRRRNGAPVSKNHRVFTVAGKGILV